ncbi:MAG: pentapeptide repeat-containing protein, partial [Pseudomonadota bacterium]|nr:pentapeptide repeat-containing protein [Pseudomonadota bacterium]
MKTTLLTVCFLLFTSQAFAIDVDTNIKKLISLNSCNNCKLVGANLSGADLSGAFLRNANLSGADLSEANLRNARL